MTTTENNMNDKMVVEEERDTFDAEEGKPGEGMRKRASNDTKLTKQLSATSQKFDVESKGSLNQAQQAMRDMDSENLGYLTNEKVYKVMLQQMKLQQEVFGLKRMSMVFLVVICLLSLATLGTSFAAATLAKDTNVVNGNLVMKDGGSVIGTANVAATFTVTEIADTTDGRRAQAFIETDGIVNGAITNSSVAKDILVKCAAGNDVRLQRKCGVSKTVEIGICPGIDTKNTETDRTVYTYTKAYGDIIIDCPCDVDNADCECSVTFPDGTPTCGITKKVNLGSAGNYAILAQTGITTTGTTAIKGDIAVSPIVATSMTGFTLNLQGTFATSLLVEGNAYAADYAVPTPAVLTTAVSDMGTAYTDAAGRVNPDAARKNLLGGNLAGITLTAGVYTFSTNVNLNGDIHFKGTENDVFIIQIAGNLKQAADYKVILHTTVGLGTPTAKNIFWQVAGLVEVGARAHMEGVLLVKTSVTFITGSSLNGRVLTQTACNLQSAAIN